MNPKTRPRAQTMRPKRSRLRPEIPRNETLARSGSTRFAPGRASVGWAAGFDASGATSGFADGCDSVSAGDVGVPFGCAAGEGDVDVVSVGVWADTKHPLR